MKNIRKSNQATPNLLETVRAAQKNQNCQKTRNEFYSACFFTLFEKIYISAYSRFPEMAEDITMDIFAKLITTDVSRFPNDTELHLENYIFRVAINYFIDLHRKNARRGLTVELAPHISNSNGSWRDVKQVELRMDLTQSKNELPDSQKEVFHLWEQGYSYEEIMDQLGLSKSAVSNRIYRAKGRLTTAFRAA